MGITLLGRQIMLVAHARRVAAVTCHLLGQKLGTVGDRLQLILNLVTIPTRGPQMTDRGLAKRNCHALDHLFQPVADTLGTVKFFLKRVDGLGLSRQCHFLFQCHQMENAASAGHDQPPINPTRALRLAPKTALSAPFCWISSINCGQMLTARSRSAS